jgi:uncharacterized protein (DUF2267 family)
MALDFEKYAAKGNEFVNMVADELQVPREMAARITRAVLHALRNRLSHEESFQLIAQLPIALKGVYADGWKYNKDFVRLNHTHDFLEEVRKEDGGQAGYDLGNDTRAQKAVAAVMKAMSYFITEGEMDDVAGMLPVELKRFILQSISSKNTVL